MSDTLATEPSRQQAVDAVRALKPPKGMSRTQWRSVRRVLSVIARHYPKSMPSVATIGAEAKLTERQTRRILRIAEAAGLLVTLHGEGRAGRRLDHTSRYHIATLTPDISGEEMSAECTPSEYSLPSVVSTSSGAVPSAQQAAVAARDPYEEPSRQVGPEPEPEPSPPVDTWARVAEVNEIGRRKKVIDSPASRERKRKHSDVELLVEYFLIGWKQVTDQHPNLRTQRVGQAKEIGGYIKTAMVAGKSVTYTPDEVRMMMDHFFLEVSAGRLSIKPGQWVWKRFVGTWSPNILPKAKAPDDWFLETPEAPVPLEQREAWWQ